MVYLVAFSVGYMCMLTASVTEGIDKPQTPHTLAATICTVYTRAGIVQV